MIELNQFQPMIQAMRDELTRVGFKELRTAEEVESTLGSAKGTALVFVNSVCGCAGGIARPGAALALQNGAKPDHLFTVFAGQDKEATAKAREYFTGYPPSSPSMALLRDGTIVHMVERHQIEGRDARSVASDLVDAFSRYCGPAKA